jgi:excisionase family DNA binding protein
MDSIKRYLNIKEAGEYLGLSTWTVRDLAGRGDIQSIKVSRKILRFDIKDIDRFMERKKRKNKSTEHREQATPTESTILSAV